MSSRPLASVFSLLVHRTRRGRCEMKAVRPTVHVKADANMAASKQRVHHNLVLVITSVDSAVCPRSGLGQNLNRRCTTNHRVGNRGASGSATCELRPLDVGTEKRFVLQKSNGVGEEFDEDGPVK